MAHVKLEALRLLWHCGNCQQGRVETLEAEKEPLGFRERVDVGTLAIVLPPKHSPSGLCDQYYV